MSITVLTENGTKNVTILADEVFDIVIIDEAGVYSSTVKGIKSFAIDGVTYTKNEIVVASVPSGITEIAVGTFEGLSALKEVVLMDRVNVTLAKGTFKNCPVLEKLTVLDCDVEFAAGSGEKAEAGIFSNCPLIATIDVSKANATFNKYSFASNTLIKNLVMGEGKTYIFREDSFRHSVLNEVVIPDNCSATLDKKCFAETTTIKYVYIGKNSIASKSIGDDNNQTSIFGGNSYLSKVVLMDITYIGKWSLSTKKPGNPYEPLCDLYVYAHSEDFSFHAEAFNDRAGNYTVYIYSADPDITSGTATSNYVIYKGIGHDYELGVIRTSTCVTPGIGGYLTDCPCGIDYRGIAYASVSNYYDDLNDVTHEPFDKNEVELPLATEHMVSDIVVNVNFVNGMTEKGFRVYKCMHCDVEAAQEEVATFAPIFVDYGYSVSTFGKISVSQCYGLERSVYNDYLEITGNEIAYGVAVAVKATVSDGKLINADGSANKNVLSYSCVSAKYDVFDVRVVGLEGRENAEIYFCGYYIVNGKVYYIDNGLSNLEEPNATSYNKIVELVKSDAE